MGGPRRPGRRRRLAGVLATLLGAGSALAALAVTECARAPIGPDAVAMVGAFSAYGPQLGALATLLLLGARSLRGGRPRRRLIVVALALTIALAALQAPRWLPDRRPAGTAGLTLVALNVRLGGADANSIGTATADADVVVFSEFTTGTAQRLAAAGFTRRFPYTLDVELPARGADGTTIYSRWPLSRAKAVAARTAHQNWSTTVTVPGLGSVTVVGVHPQRPFLDGTTWREDQRLVTNGLPRGPLTVVAGDFNAVPDQISVPGLTSASDIVGTGWLTTFPASPTVPRLLRIDHVLVGSGLTVTALSSVVVTGTDHTGLRCVIKALRNS